MNLFRTHEDYIELRRWESRLAALLESLADRLDIAEREDAAEYLAHGESGLLIEFVADWIGEDERPITDEERAVLLALAGELDEQVRDRVARSLSPPGGAGGL
ncbi:MafI family immunity protein [Actinoallomurus iriomotensis]|uniref:MafI family immunity protein n=1 Tax=Actinoallomurus iriomotensis TaxID=478107 RepID=A0A9W6SC66_9ACTN|nr:MafI family immunity protein [Actinoallomurus iriomotensis]GLY90899.1 hypothetical protein Airi02_088280 [Actinoallomurus iriomotensis]